MVNLWLLGPWLAKAFLPVAVVLADDPLFDMSPWLTGMQTQIVAAVTQAGPFVFVVVGALASIGLIMKLVSRITGGGGG